MMSRKSVAQSIILLLIGIFYLSCNSDNPVSSESSLQITLKSTEQYEYNTKIGGDEEGAKIITQANHYRRSEIVRDESTFWAAIYKYEPASGYTGRDYVEIETQTGSDGAGPPTEISLIRITFFVTN